MRMFYKSFHIVWCNNVGIKILYVSLLLLMIGKGLTFNIEDDHVIICHVYQISQPMIFYL